ncbi:MAG: hypothetical protein DWQ05_09215 [Calditrichaeota bacterium]|nr:MAG: hypothetical protein DWQ05_09215 [Calditrichota bacterium]
MKNKKIGLLITVYFLSSAFLFAQDFEPAPPPPADEKEQFRVQGMRAQEKRAAVAAMARVPLTDSQKAEALQFLTELVPESAPVLAELESENPRNYERELQKAWREKQMLSRQKNFDKDEYQTKKSRIILEHKIQVLVYKYRKASDSEKDRLKNDIRGQLGQLFDLREVDRAMQVQRLEKKLEELRASLKNRKPNKDRIIEKRLERLIGIDKELEW